MKGSYKIVLYILASLIFLIPLIITTVQEFKNELGDKRILAWTGSSLFFIISTILLLSNNLKYLSFFIGLTILSIPLILTILKTIENTLPIDKLILAYLGSILIVLGIISLPVTFLMYSSGHKTGYFVVSTNVITTGIFLFIIGYIL